jgi:esterase/lipase
MMREFCKVRDGKEEKPIIYFLHGFDSSQIELKTMARKFNESGFTTYNCDARGHGSRKNESSPVDFMGTVNDYNQLINENNTRSVLVGISMGGVEALKIGNENELVTDVFAISAAHDDSEFDNESFREYIKKTYEEPLLRKGFNTIAPKYYESSMDTIFHLIHDKKDKLVPFDQFLKNKDHFNVSDDDTLVYDHTIQIKGLNQIFHVYPRLPRNTQKWIEKKI